MIINVVYFKFVQIWTTVSKNPSTRKKKLFATRSRFELLKPTEPPNETIVEESQSTADQAPISSKPLPPIFLRVIEDIPGTCVELVELIGADNFICKSTVDHVKIQTSNPEAYRSLVHYFRNE